MSGTGGGGGLTECCPICGAADVVNDSPNADRWRLCLACEAVWDRDSLADRAARRDEGEAAVAAVARVRLIHVVNPARRVRTPWCEEDGHDWPCPTIRALDGGLS